MKTTITKFLLIGAVLLSSMLFGGCTKISPGHVGIFVNNYGSDKGVSNYAAQTGMQMYNPVTTDVFEYPTYIQTAKWTSKVDDGNPKNEEICFATATKVQLCTDVSLSYHLVPNLVPQFYAKFRSDNLMDFTHGFLYNVARGSFGDVGPQFTVDEAMTTRRMELVQAATAKINEQIRSYGVVIDQLDFIGQPRPPKDIAQSINDTQVATQNAIKVENELRAVEAEAKKNIAQAEGIAAANKAKNQTITPQLLKLRELEIQEKMIEKWNGQMPMYSGGQMPMMLLNNSK